MIYHADAVALLRGLDSDSVDVIRDGSGLFGDESAVEIGIWQNYRSI